MKERMRGAGRTTEWWKLSSLKANRGQRPGEAYNEAHDWVYQNIRTLQALTTKAYYLNYAGE